MADDELLDESPMPPDLPPEAETRRYDRRRMDPPERRQHDLQLARHLDGLGASPWTRKVTDIVDVISGEAFRDVNPIIEHWLFAGTAKQRAAEFNLLFSAYHAQADTSGFRAYVLRLPLAKAPLGQLGEALKSIAKLYGRTMENAKRDGLAKPVAVFVHPRWDNKLKAWDVHLHCIADVSPDMEDRFFLRLALKFSTPASIGPAKNMAAFANYSSAWVIDHRELPAWPDNALLEFWSLKAPQLIRKGGDFAAFVRRNRDKRFRWEGDGAVMEDKEPRQRRQDAREHPSRSARQVAYAEVRIGGRKRHCAILKHDRNDPRREHAHPERTSPQAASSRTREKSTTITGSIPSTPIGDRTTHRDLRRLHRRMAVWEKIWPWGTPHRPPGPIRRRLARAGVVIETDRSERARTGRQGLRYLH